MRGSWDRERDPLAALRRGEPGLFEDFVRSETTTFIGFFQRLGGSRVEAEDMTQEVFLKLFRQAGHYQPQGTFEAFALRVARNAWIDRRRRDAARIPVRALSAVDGEIAGEREPEARAEDLAGRLTAAEDRRRIAAAVKRLSFQHALIFELAVVQSRPYPEIAAELGIPLGTVKSRVFHALRQLRASLESPEGARGARVGPSPDPDLPAAPDALGGRP